MSFDQAEIRPDTEVAADIRKAVKALNWLIVEAEKQKGLTVEISLLGNKVLDPIITKVY